MMRRWWEDGEKRPLAEALQDQESGYLPRSRYHAQLSRYLEHFSAEQILVVDADELRDDRMRVLRDAHRFLGVATDHRSLHHRRKFNQGRYHVLAPVPGPRRLRRELGRAMAVLSPRRPPEVSEALRAWIADQLREDAQRFRELTGRGFAHWSV
jgi:hypothetical protein